KGSSSRANSSVRCRTRTTDELQPADVARTRKDHAMDQPRHVKDLVSLVPFVVAGALSFLNPANVAAAQADQRADTPAVTGAEMNERERKFSESMANVVLTGRFTTDGQNGTPEPERYHIVSATKLAGDNWVIVARISYGKRDVQPPPVPIPV